MGEESTYTVANSDRVALWEVPLNSGLYCIEFDHGTTSGKRIVRVNGQEVIRKEWMFKLVGSEEFPIGESLAKIRVDPFGMFAYRYSLEVDGRPFKKFMEKQSKILKTWTVKAVDGTDLRIVLEKDSLDIWVNGQKVDTESEFVDGGTKTHFQANNCPATLHALMASLHESKTLLTSGLRKRPIIYSLTFNGEEIPEASE